MAEKTALLAPRSRRESPSPAAFPLPFSTVVVSTWGSWMWEMRSHKRRHPHQGGMGAQVTPLSPRSVEPLRWVLPRNCLQTRCGAGIVSALLGA